MTRLYGDVAPAWRDGLWDIESGRLPDPRAALPRDDLRALRTAERAGWSLTPRSVLVLPSGALAPNVDRVDPSHPLVAESGSAGLWRAVPAFGRGGRRDEERTSEGGASVGAGAAGGGDVLVGHFSVFDEWAEINSVFEGHFMERVAPGAYRATLRDDVQRVLLNHGGDPGLGDRPLGPASAREDSVGARYEVPLLAGVPELVLAGLSAGLYGSSFRFRVMREEVVDDPGASEANPKGLPERTIIEAKVMEYGPVTFAAYAGAEAGLAA